MTISADSLRVSVILPVVDETTSLDETVRIVLAENTNHISEILIVVCKITTPEALAVCERLRHSKPDFISVRYQNRPFLGGAMRDAFEWATGSHVLMMASDLETDPKTVKDLIAKASQGYDIVTATRWSKSGGFQGYDPLKYVLNWIFQVFLKILYQTRLTDLTYGFRIFRSEWVRKVDWRELRHPFLLETILKPLRLGARVTEIPTNWIARKEGQSHNPFLQNFLYFRTALRVRFESKQKMLRSTNGGPVR